MTYAQQDIPLQLSSDALSLLPPDDEPANESPQPLRAVSVETGFANGYHGSGPLEPLQQALSDAYLLNPVLNAERAKLRATDEGVSVSKAGLRPTVITSGDTGYANTHNDIAGNNPIGEENFGPNGDILSDGVTNPGGYSVGVSQPLFEGFQNLNAIRKAKSSVQAGREGLRAVEQAVLLAGVTAYAGVMRDQTIVGLRENNVKVLTGLREQTRGQFKAGEVTRTDVAQATARLSSAIAALNAARARLKKSRATYAEVVGHPPGRLVSLPSIFNVLPKTLDAAMTLADAQNPVILGSVYEEEASLYNVNEIMGELLPSVTLEAQYEQRSDVSKVLVGEEVTSVVGRVSMPLYQAGGVAARVRQAKETNTQRKREVEAARLRAHSDVVGNWGVLQSSAAEIASAKEAVDANRIALDGSVKEQKIGQRSTLAVLDTQRDLVESEVALVEAIHNRLVAEYSLAAATGRLDAQSLGLSVPYYDPTEHYDLVKNKWLGLRPPAPALADN